MYAPLNQLPDTARIWLYQAERDLTDAEVAIANAHLRAFCADWVAHGQPLRVSFTVARNRFVLLAADEAVGTASGCSIDSSVRALRELGARLGVDFLDKARIAYLTPDDVLATLTRPELRAAVADGRLQPDTLIFDNTLASLGAWRQVWPRPAAQSWLGRYFVGEKQA